MNRDELKNEPPAISYLIEQRLKERSLGETTEALAHLDEDTITAFVEARLEEPEYLSAVSHLVKCSECRSTTAQLVRLEFELDESNESTPYEESSSRLGAFLSGIAANLIPADQEDAVFAYQNPETEKEEPPAESPTSDSETNENQSDSK